MGLYEAFRTKPWGTQYSEIHTAASIDVFDAGLIFAFGSIAFSCLILLPGYMPKERYSVALRIFLSIFIGAAILFSNFGMDWERSEVKTNTQYKAFMRQEIKAKVGVKIGLRGINVTLKGLPVKQNFDHDKTTEHIDYNEKFRWNSPWSQGRLGFGPNASPINNEFHAALLKGIPYPILIIAEYFTLDGESIRWGRGFRLAGFYTQMFLWFAFTLWVITNILFLMVIRYGAYFLSLTGVTILFGNLIYDKLHWGPQLLIPFPGGHLSFEYGWCFWLSLATGFLCLLLGVVIVSLDYLFPGPVATFFNIDIGTEFEDIVEETEMISPAVSDQDMEDHLPTSAADDDETTEECESTKKRIQFVSRSRYAGISSRGPSKSPLAAVKSYPITTKERGDDDITERIPRSQSVKITIEPPEPDKYSSENGAFQLDEDITRTTKEEKSDEKF